MGLGRDTFGDGTISIVTPKRPKPGGGWRECEVSPVVLGMGFPVRAWLHVMSGLYVLSAVEVAQDDDGVDRGFEFHLSVSRPTSAGPTRCDGVEAEFALEEFGLVGAEEDNHVPFGKVRNFWRPASDQLVGLECACKEEEPAIVEDKGDFVWRP